MKQVTVSGAVILRTNTETNQKEIFVTQRGYGDYKDGWEIPAESMSLEKLRKNVLSAKLERSLQQRLE